MHGWFALRQLLRGSPVIDAGMVSSSNEREATREIFFYVPDEDLIKLAMDTGDATTTTRLREQVFAAHPRRGVLDGISGSRSGAAGID